MSAESNSEKPEAADDDRYQRSVVLHPSGQMSVSIQAVMAHPKFKRQLQALQRIRERLSRPTASGNPATEETK